MAGSKTWQIITTNDGIEIERTTYALQMPGGCLVRHETIKAQPGGNVSESMAFVPNAQLIEYQPAMWAIFSEHLTSAQPRTLPA